MRTRNPNNTRSRRTTEGATSPRTAGSRGITFRDGITEAHPVRDLLVIGGVVTDNDDGTAILTIGDGDPGSSTPAVNTPITAALSNPPTQAELETAIGSAAGEAVGQSYVVTDDDTGRVYAVWSDGSRFDFVPIVSGSGSSSILSAATGSSNSLQGSATAAEYYNGYTYIAYMTAASDIAVRAWNHATATITAEVLVHNDISTDDNSAIPPPDSHDVPTLLVDPVDHKLMIFYSGHDGPALYMSVSDTSLDTDPDMSDGFTERDLDTELGSTSTGYTYTQCAALGNTIVIVFRSVVGTGGIHANAEWAFSTAAAGTRTFAAQTTLGKEPSHGMYLMMSQTGASRLDFIASSKSAFDEAGGSLFHFYMLDDGSVFDSTDTEITASLPLDTSDMTAVWTSNGTQRGWLGHVALGSDGIYRALLVEIETVSPLDARYVYSVLTGAWGSDEIVGTGSGAAFFSGVFEPGTANAVWLVKDDASTTEVFRYTTLDYGVTWTAQQITDASAEDNDTLIPVRNANPDLKVLWVLGSHAGNEVVDGDIWGAGVVSVEGLDAQRVVVIDDTALAEAIFRRTSGGDWQISRDLGSTWEDLGGGSPLTTKGDIHGFDTDDARIPAGADGTVLTADSGAALGVSWQTPSSGGAHYLVIASSHSTPLIFGDLVQASAGDDLIYTS